MRKAYNFLKVAKYWCALQYLSNPKRSQKKSICEHALGCKVILQEALSVFEATFATKKRYSTLKTLRWVMVLNPTDCTTIQSWVSVVGNFLVTRIRPGDRMTNENPLRTNLSRVHQKKKGPWKNRQKMPYFTAPYEVHGITHLASHAVNLLKVITIRCNRNNGKILFHKLCAILRTFYSPQSRERFPGCFPCWVPGPRHRILPSPAPPLVQFSECSSEAKIRNRFMPHVHNYDNEKNFHGKILMLDYHHILVR